MTTPVSSRASVELRALTTAEHLLCVLVGLAIAASGGYFELIEVKSPPSHTVHIAIFAAWTIVGVLIALPKQVFPIVQQIFVIVGPYIPGGRRATDPPKGAP